MRKNIRDYGLPNSEVLSVPVTKELPEHLKKEPCPNCGCQSLAMLEVDVKQDLVRGGVGKGVYIGCPACPWASPLSIRQTIKGDEDG